MAPGGNLAHQRRKSLSDPAKHKERRIDAVSVKEIEQPARIGNDAAGHRSPLVTAHDVVERAHVKIVLDVDCHGVSYRGGFAPAVPPRHALSRGPLSPAPFACGRRAELATV